MKRILTLKHLKKTDPETAAFIAKEEARQFDTINLIASENYVSPAVREAEASVGTNKYSEGYAGARYYPGNKFIDEIERLCQSRALKLFGLTADTWAVNVQPYSGSPANFAVYDALLGKNDVALGMALDAGGHLTHGYKVSDSGKYFHFEQYGLTNAGEIDFEQIEELARKFKPRLIVCGASSYSRIIDFARFGQIAKKHGALLMADIAHIAGLIAASLHPSPFPSCNIVTTTTHKTLRGPRGAMIFSHKELSEKINKAVFPGLQGGPHNNTTAAIAVALHEAATPKFLSDMRQTVTNAKVLARELTNLGYSIISLGTDNHLMLVSFLGKKMTGGQAQEKLEQVGITANRNAIPNDPRKPWDPSGIRLGTPAATTRGMREDEMRQIAQFIDRTLKADSKIELNKIKREVKELARQFPPPGF